VTPVTAALPDTVSVLVWFVVFVFATGKPGAGAEAVWE